MIILFDFSRKNNLGIGPIVADDDWNQQTGYWLSGHIFGYYINWFLPWRRRMR
jgi:hypothetical protein